MTSPLRPNEFAGGGDQAVGNRPGVDRETALGDGLPDFSHPAGIESLCFRGCLQLSGKRTQMNFRRSACCRLGDGCAIARLADSARSCGCAVDLHGRAL